MCNKITTDLFVVVPYKYIWMSANKRVIKKMWIMRIRLTVSIAIFIVVLCIVTGGWLHHRASIAEESHAKLTLVTSYKQVKNRLTIVNVSHLPQPVHDAMKEFELFPTVKPSYSPRKNVEQVMENLISYRNQLYITRYSQIYAFYTGSKNSPQGNVDGLGYEEPDWVIVCTGLSVPRTTWSTLEGSPKPSLYTRIDHDLIWYFGIPDYPDSWSVWLYSADTGKMIESTSGSTPPSSWVEYVLPTS